MSHATVPAVQCPTWCTIPLADHEVEALDPTSSWYRHDTVIGSGKTQASLTRLQMFVSEDVDEMTIHVGDSGDDYLTIEEASVVLSSLQTLVAATKEGRPMMAGTSMHPDWCDQRLCDTADAGTADEFTVHRAKIGKAVEAVVATDWNGTIGQVVVSSSGDCPWTTANARSLARDIATAADMVDTYLRTVKEG